MNFPISSKLMTRIVNDLVRLDDIVEGKKIYGSITEQERRFICDLMQEAKNNGIDRSDIIESIKEYFKNTLVEIGPITPITASPTTVVKTAQQTATPNASTQRPVTPADKAANVAVQLKSMNPQQLQKELEKNVTDYIKKDPNLSKNLNQSFAAILANMVKGQQV